MIENHLQSILRLSKSQKTKYTLLGVTALVLGGASLIGGRGGAFGAILGAGTLYLINYILVTFRFERLQR